MGCNCGGSKSARRPRPEPAVQQQAVGSPEPTPALVAAMPDDGWPAPEVQEAGRG